MKKIISSFIKLLVWIILGLFSAMFALAFMIGIAEGDLSYGLWDYFQ